MYISFISLNDRNENIKKLTKVLLTLPIVFIATGFSIYTYIQSNYPHGLDYSYLFTVKKKWVSDDYFISLGDTNYKGGVYRSNWIVAGDNDETSFFNISINPDDCEVGNGKVVWRYIDQGYQTIDATFKVGGEKPSDKTAEYICKVATGEITESKNWLGGLL